MSRIGKQPIQIPEDVTAAVGNDAVVIKGPKGELRSPTFSHIKVEVTKGMIEVKRTRNDDKTKALHGLTRALLANAVKGVVEGYEKRLELVGTGYRVKKEGNRLTLNLGFSHPIVVEPETGIEFEVEGERDVIVKGIDKEAVGLAAAKLRSLKKPEPYKGKGVRYKNEIVRRKPGKVAKVGTAATGGA